MNKLINVLKNNMRNKRIVITVIVILLMLVTLITIILIQNTSNKNVPDTKKDLNSFEESDLSEVLSGINDMTILVGSTDIDYMNNIFYNEEIVKSIDVDSSNVNLMQIGEYQITYKITVYTAKLNEYLSKPKNSSKEINSINIKRKVTVVSLEDAQALANNDIAVYTSKNNTVVKSDGSSVTIPDTSTIENGNKTSDPSNKDNNSSSSGSNSNGGNSNSSSGSGGNNSSSTDTPAKHEHNWTAITKVKHHDAIGHYETQVVQAAYDEPIYESRAICGCGADITNNIDMHYADGCGSGYSVKKVQIGTKHHEAVTKQVWVQDSAAWYETKTTGYRCSECGKTK